MEEFKERLKQIGGTGKRFGREVQARTVGYIIGGLSFVVGLAWNEAIKEVIEYIFPKSGGTAIAKLVYAFFITILVVLLSIYLERITRKPEPSEEAIGKE